MADNDLVIDVVARLDAFQKTMAEMPEIGAQNAKLMAAEINKSVRAAEKAQRDAAKATLTANKSAASGSSAAWSTAFKGMGEGAKSAGFGSIVEQTNNAMAAVQDLGSVAGVAAGVLGGPATIAIAALTAAAVIGAVAWEGYSAESERTAAIAKEVADAHTALLPLLKDARLADIDLALATGQITEEAARLEKDGIASMEKFAAATKAASDRVKALHSDEGGFKRWVGDLAEVAQQSTILQITSLGLVNVLAAETTSSSEAQAEINTLMGTIGEAAEVTKRGVTAHNAAVHATNAHASAARAADAAIKALNEDLAEAAALGAANSKAFHDDEQGLRELEAGAQRAMASKEEQLALDHRAASERAAAYLADANAHADTISAKETAEAQYRATVKALDAEYYAGLDDLRKSDAEKLAKEAKKMADDVAAAQQQQEDAWLGVAQSVAGAVDKLSSAFAKTYDTSTAEGRKAAEKQWKTQHGLQIATAVALAAVGVAQNESAYPYPANIPGTIAAGIAGAANIAAVTAVQPSFHTGGLAPDEVFMGGSRMQADEGIGVISKQGMGAFRDANAGITPGSSAPVTVNLKLRHQTIDSVVAQNIQRGGLTSRAIAQNDSVPFGHRRDTWRR